MSKLNIKRDDTVVVISGKDKGKKGKVTMALPKEERVVVHDVNKITRHTKPKKQGQPGGRIVREDPIHVSNVMLICPKCNSATRVAHQFIEEKGEGDKPGIKKVRVCKKCGKQID